MPLLILKSFLIYLLFHFFKREKCYLTEQTHFKGKLFSLFKWHYYCYALLYVKWKLSCDDSLLILRIDFFISIIIIIKFET